MEELAKYLTFCAAGGAVLFLAAYAAATALPPIRAALERLVARAGCFPVAALLCVAVAWGGSKSGGRVEYPRTSSTYTFLADAGSSVSNDFVTVAYTRHTLLPDDADLQVWRRHVDLTNDTDWVEHLVTTVGAFPSPQRIDFPMAISNDWSVFTTWAPAPSVHTNGVLNVLWRGIPAPLKIHAIPLGTEVREGGKAIAPPERSK